MKSIKILLNGIVDYAGLFPPANLDMLSAVKNYSKYLNEENSWLLGRFILPLSRFEEFEKEFLPHNNKQWKVSTLGGGNVSHDIEKIVSFNKYHSNSAGNGNALIDTIEIKANSSDEIKKIMKTIPNFLVPYIEVPITDDPTELIETIKKNGARAKVRTGGVTNEAFPSTSNLLRFINSCVKMNVPFKATAGLHHPIRSVHKLTYQKNSPEGMMYGFLNVFLTAGFLSEGMDLKEASKLLEETNPEIFKFDDDGIYWREYKIGNGKLLVVRQNVAISFGSCSFSEPIEDLRKLKLL